MRESSAYVGLGSNLGDRSFQLLMAIRAIVASGLPVIHLSRIYETEPLDVLAQPMFLNMVVELRGHLPPPEQLLARLLEIESSLGRTREVERGPRTIDLDLLLYDHLRVDTASLRLPHPRMQQRRFVLEPLAEIAPNLLHPVLNKTIRELLAASPDRSRVSLFHGSS
jgi:2-amino-4-hydroxy-6-hydroxymethyldihydropteridine diphosphokinase